MLEVIATSVEDAKRIEAYGGDRIELVSNMDQDGLTPTYELVERVVKSVDIPVRVMIRDADVFDFSSSQLQSMMDFSESISDLPIDGYVYGDLKSGCINTSLLSNFKRQKITWHRAIDRTSDIIASYSELINDVDQILTSGGLGALAERFEYLKAFYTISQSHLLIGSGINKDTIASYAHLFPKANFHVGSGARKNNDFNEQISKENIQAIKAVLLEFTT